MVKRLILLSFALGLVGAALPVKAQQPAAAVACPPAPVLPPEWKDWASPIGKVAAGDPARLAKSDLPLETAVRAVLPQTGAVSYVVMPEKPGGSVSYGGKFRFTVAEAGTYRIALGSGAWIDVLDGKSAVESTSHGHGPECSTIRKMVDFPLKSGVYTLQIAANGSPSVTVKIARQP